MTLLSCRFEDYGIALVKNGTVLKASGATIARLQYQRVLDGVSQASVEIITPGDDCCGQLGAVDHWNTDLIIFAKNDAGVDEVVWRGPCQQPEFARGSVKITATDVLSWLQVRYLEIDRDFVSEDVSDIFVELAEYALTKDPENVPLYSFVKYDSGVVESRKIEARSMRMTWNVVGEMLNNGLDVTTFGSQILVGVPAFTAIELRDTDVLGDVRVVKDGKLFANRVIGNASRDVVGKYPEQPAGAFGYPLVELINSDTQLPDEESAIASAKARYDYSVRGVRRVQASGGLRLLPSSGIDVKRLLAGQLFNFAATETCYSARETLRLGSLDVTVTKGREEATISLQPVGNVQGGNTL